MTNIDEALDLLVKAGYLDTAAVKAIKEKETRERELKMREAALEEAIIEYLCVMLPKIPRKEHVGFAKELVDMLKTELTAALWEPKDEKKEKEKDILKDFFNALGVEY